MSNVTQLIILIAVPLAAAALLVAGYALFVNSRRGRLSGGEPGPASAQIADARLDEGERPASLVSEQIEQMVRARLAEHPDLADVSLDFGAAGDGSIDIWVSGEQYDNPDDIPDERIREAIRAAVEAFNQ
jgi:hypothetical protein